MSDRAPWQAAGDVAGENEPPAVSQRFRLALPLYLCMMLALAIIGVANQRLLNQQVGLIDAKEGLLADVAAARPAAAAIDGPEAVANWAEANGMVILPEAGGASLVAPAPAPATTVIEPTMELRTVWR